MNRGRVAFCTPPVWISHFAPVTWVVLHWTGQETMKQNTETSSSTTGLASTVANGAAFVVGDGAQSATARLDGTQKF